MQPIPERNAERSLGGLCRVVLLALAFASLAACARQDVTPGSRDSVAAPAAPAGPLAAAAQLAPPPSAALVARLATQEGVAIARIPAGSGHDLVLANCLICHSAAMIEQQHKDTTGWNKTVTQMIAWGAPVSAAQTPVLVAYLADHFPARAAGSSAQPLP